MGGGTKPSPPPSPASLASKPPPLDEPQAIATRTAAGSTKSDRMRMGSA